MILRFASESVTINKNKQIALSILLLSLVDVRKKRMQKTQLLKLIYKYLKHNRNITVAANMAGNVITFVIFCLSSLSGTVVQNRILSYLYFHLNSISIFAFYGNFTHTYTFDGANSLCIMSDCQYIDFLAISTGDWIFFTLRLHGELRFFLLIIKWEALSIL